MAFWCLFFFASSSYICLLCIVDRCGRYDFFLFSSVWTFIILLCIFFFRWLRWPSSFHSLPWESTVYVTTVWLYSSAHLFLMWKVVDYINLCFKKMSVGAAMTVIIWRDCAKDVCRITAFQLTTILNMIASIYGLIFEINGRNKLRFGDDGEEHTDIRDNWWNAARPMFSHMRNQEWISYVDNRWMTVWQQVQPSFVVLCMWSWCASWSSVR